MHGSMMVGGLHGPLLKRLSTQSQETETTAASTKRSQAAASSSFRPGVSTLDIDEEEKKEVDLTKDAKSYSKYKRDMFAKQNARSWSSHAKRPSESLLGGWA